MPGLIPLVLQGSPTEVHRNSLLKPQPCVEAPSLSSISVPNLLSLSARISKARSCPSLRTHRKIDSDESSSKSELRSSAWSRPFASRLNSDRRSLRQAPSALPSASSAPTDWGRAVVEVKAAYLARKYRVCSARCQEVLAKAHDESIVAPAHLIYLNFYAAASLEVCARPLLPTSSYRATLIHQAREHYRNAQQLIQLAEETALEGCRPSSAASYLNEISYTPTVIEVGQRGQRATHSPTLSSSSSRMWAPQLSPVCSLSEEWMTDSSCSVSSISSPGRNSPSSKPPAKKKKKKVSFALPAQDGERLADLRWPSASSCEPLIRPDSPTLGFDDEYYVAALQRLELPDPPIQKSNMHARSLTPLNVPAFHTVRADSPLYYDSPTMTEDSSCTSDEESYCYHSRSRHHQLRSTASSGSLGQRVSPFGNESNQRIEPMTAPMASYLQTLAHLRAQVASHLAALEESRPRDTSILESVEFGPASPRAKSLEGTYATSKYMSRRDDETATYRQARSSRIQRSAPSIGIDPSAAYGEESRSLEDRQARIKRLRMNGWQRKRFDARKYENLRHSVLAELG